MHAPYDSHTHLAGRSLVAIQNGGLGLGARAFVASGGPHAGEDLVDAEERGCERVEEGEREGERVRDRSCACIKN